MKLELILEIILEKLNMIPKMTIIVFLIVFVLLVVLVITISKLKNSKKKYRTLASKVNNQINSGSNEKPVSKEYEIVRDTSISETDEALTLLTKLLTIGFSNQNMTELSNKMVYLLQEYYNVDFVTLYKRGNDGWFSTLATNMPKFRLTKTERYYNKESENMVTDSKVELLEEYEKDSFLRSVNVEYSNFTIIKNGEKVVGALLLEHGNRKEVEKNKNQFQLYDRVFKTTSLVFSHIIEISDLIKSVSTDQLTNIYNRRFIDVTLDEEVLKHNNLGQTFFVSMMDIDYFKKFNDTYGHQFGDVVLKEVSKFIKNKLGKHSWVARYGGEEFLIFMSNSTSDNVFRQIDYIREGISNLQVTFEGQSVNVTASFGVAGFPKDGHSKEEIISNADKSLYQSKENGRNRVTLWNKEENTNVIEFNNINTSEKTDTKIVDRPQRSNGRKRNG